MIRIYCPDSLGSMVGTDQGQLLKAHPHFPPGNSFVRFAKARELSNTVALYSRQKPCRYIRGPAQP